MQEAADIMHQAKFAPNEASLVDIDHRFETLSPKVTMRPDALQDEKPGARNLESRNLEKVTKRQDCILQDQDGEEVIGQLKEKTPGARKSVQFSDDC